MWLLVATVCLTLDITSCETLYYTPQTFFTEEKCIAQMQIDLPAMNDRFVMVHPRCIEIPGQMNS